MATREKKKTIKKAEETPVEREWKDAQGRKYKVGSLVWVEASYQKWKLAPYKATILEITDRGCKVDPQKLDYYKHCLHGDVRVIRYNYRDLEAEAIKRREELIRQEKETEYGKNIVRDRRRRDRERADAGDDDRED